MNESGPSKQDRPLLDLEEIAMLKELALNKAGRDTYQDLLVQFKGKLVVKHPDFEYWRAYHALMGSTVMPELESKVIEGDFPDKESSVKTFLEEIIYK